LPAILHTVRVGLAIPPPQEGESGICPQIDGQRDGGPRSSPKIAVMIPAFMTRAELLSRGLTRRTLQLAVREGSLIHVRRDRYLPHDTHEHFIQAVRVGGQLTCLSLLALLGIFVLDNPRLHVHVSPRGSRLRAPENRRVRLARAGANAPVVHWNELLDTTGASCAVSIVDALAHAVRCQPVRAAVATLDSALNRGLITRSELRDVFGGLPARFRAIEALVDGRAESGPETFVRLIARMLGCDVRLQVGFAGIGRVDLLLDGWLVVECDSKGFHAEWRQRERDFERDLALAARGYLTLRLTAAAIMYRPDEVHAALRTLLASRPAA
jgi:hypothetical protein